MRSPTIPRKWDSNAKIVKEGTIRKAMILGTKAGNLIGFLYCINFWLVVVKTSLSVKGR